ncbi:acetaldehyde dehydrogenase (acetylating) [Paenibacillus lignilyticus]|uniref:Acetaldehyde dehydrogenase (Acetylating) n=1 Tax=Paenibacillus lignilyticus TaxID=1172615 RepID=A0ABS5CAL8_9BACL|nr:acetaldehyde dehydrogenase (acetylating) [Paenibacillus lignilyticus]MBP3962742.1 acetaldehyde dehydrogenase (acetylating) [Paenibacillus lignilyticus]
MKLDVDLQAIQEVRYCLQEAKEAQKQYESMTQLQVDRIVEAMASAAEEHAERLGKLAVEETGFGNIPDKKAKNLFVARDVYEAIKAMKTVGIIGKDEERGVWEVAQPVGVVAAIVPSTNPTSTVLFKSLIALKARNAVVISPHPAALRCSQEAAKLMRQAAEQAGAPAGLIQCLSYPSVEASMELMKHKLTDVILATGGSAMVKAAYSSGKPAYGVGPGNVPVFVHHSADLVRAASQIVQSKTFDYGTICASEQAIVVERQVKSQLADDLKRHGAHMLSGQEKERVASIIMSANGKSLNPKIVGKSPQVLAAMAGISVPQHTTVLVAEETGVGLQYPLSVEKLTPILALYAVDDWQEGSRRCTQLLELGGLGHTLGIHCEDERIIEAFGLMLPASRIIVNAGTTFGGIGATTGIQPSMTLGCGSLGHNITSDNIGPQHVMNVKRVAFGIRERPSSEPAAAQLAEQVAGSLAVGISREEVLAIVKSVLSQMKL